MFIYKIVFKIMKTTIDVYKSNLIKIYTTNNEQTQKK